MNKPEVKINHLQVNIKAPQELHLVRPHSAKKSKPSSQTQIPQSIQQQTSCQQSQQPISAHKIKHLQSLEDKGQFVDENQQQRVSYNDEARETITRTIHPQQQLPINDVELQKIAEQEVNEAQNSKSLKHINMQNVYDKDEFNLRNSRQKQTQKKRRLSESNVECYFEENNHFPVVTYLTQLQKSIPEKVIEEQINLEKKQKVVDSPSRRHRKNSLHTGHGRQGVSEQIQRMIVDELDKKKKVKNQQQTLQQNEENQMESIKEQKQEDDAVNITSLEQTRQKIQGQIQNLSKVVGKQIGPQQKKHLFMQKQEPIEEESKQKKQE